MGLVGVVLGLGLAMAVLGGCAADAPGECRRFDACCKALAGTPAAGNELCTAPHTTTEVCTKSMNDLTKALKLEKAIKIPAECAR
jgi:hypothetical protein